jgi:hypothetical protein
MIFIEMGRETATLISAVLKEESYREASGSEAGRIPREWLEKIRRAALAYERNISTAAGIFAGVEEKNPNLPAAPSAGI